MGDDPLLLGLDVGTTRIKALLLDATGEQVVISRVATPFARGEHGTEMGVHALEAAARGALEGLGPERRRVVGIGVAGLAESGAPLDRAGRPLAPILAWHDPRGAATVRGLDDRLGDALSLRIGQRLRAVSSVAKLGWLLGHGVDGVSRWLGVPELCLFRLTGAQVTEHSLAARTGCYDVTSLVWMPEVAQLAGFGIDVFPPVEKAGTELGRVSRRGAEWSGLPEGAVVTLAGHDHLAGADGCGATEGDLVNSVGTAETVISRHREPPDVAAALDARIAVTVRPGGEGWATLASAARSGMVLGQVAELLGSAPDQLDGIAGGPFTEEVGDWLDAVGRGDRPAPPLALPGAVWGAVLQFLALRTSEAIGRLTSLTGRSAARLVVFGGGSRSWPWLWAKAAAAPVPVWRSSAEEAVARGAALRAGVAVGWWPSPAEAPAAALHRVTGREVPASTPGD